MSVNDAMLSAFLDAELEEADMEQVREALAEDLRVADRLAALANVDMVVQQAAEKATEAPMPAAVLALLEDAPAAQADTSAKVVELSTWQRLRKHVSVPVSLAAGIAVMVGLSVFNMPQQSPAANWERVAQVMDSNLTGETYQADNGLLITPQLSFQNHDGAFCRQVEAQSEAELKQWIGCKNNRDEWVQVAQITLPATSQQGAYRTASASKALDDVLDKIMASSPMNRSQEQQAIRNHWLASPAKE